ncbi:sensor domain-containing diguanylate cyclase [Deferribacter autotrophicus]|uniref:diguanylate cyclase n=1 Tax=Deferribacter autotrophicus TaxID=500465 RepID=A0A5A8F784_9BACT|nr:GGDEF domain-containing protein [Deferribacter autotrophicus]KAA0257716.1 sensor domain-containing diguanylate cyclase [Deferribacter autotrophicus]
MSKKLNEILKENHDLKKELEGILELIKENEVKQKGFKVVEYAFLLSESIDEIAKKPLKYLEEIFEIDKAALFIDREAFPFERESDIIDEKVYFVEGKIFKYFFLEKKVYAGVGRVNFISEYDVCKEMNSYLISPIIENGKIIGSLNLYSANPKRFIERRGTDFIKDLSFKIAVSLRKLFDAERLSKQMLIDFLTGSYNKLALYDFLERFVNMYERYGKSFAFGIFDIDNFKEINDTKGHLAGDDFLKSFAKILRETFRKADIVGRFGGDEFYLILPEANNLMTQGVAKKIKDIVARLRVELALPETLDITGGIVLVPSEEISEIKPEYIIKVADEKLYKGKNTGNGKIIGVNDDILS